MRWMHSCFYLSLRIHILLFTVGLSEFLCWEDLMCEWTSSIQIQLKIKKYSCNIQRRESKEEWGVHKPYCRYLVVCLSYIWHLYCLQRNTYVFLAFFLSWITKERMECTNTQTNNWRISGLTPRNIKQFTPSTTKDERPNQWTAWQWGW